MTSKDRSYVWQTPNSLAPGGYDYFVFVPASATRI